MDEKDKQKLEEVVAELQLIKGRHTELVTVMIPAGYNVNAVVRQLEGEKSTATNIKSKQTRSAVIESLEKIIRELKGMQKAPPNGLALFAGNVSDKEGDLDVELWMVEPPKPLKVRMYRCDQRFVTEPLEEFLLVDEIYGLLVIDRQEATIGLLEGKRIKVLKNFTSGVPGKVRAGGQSAQRFHRITEGLAKEFFRKISEEMKAAFFELPRLKGIMVGGPIPTKEEFLEEGHLVTKLREKVMSVQDIGYVDEHGLELLVEASQEEIAEQEIIKEKKILEKYFNTLGKHSELAIYGDEKIDIGFTRGAIDTLLISKKISKEKLIELEKKAQMIGSKIHIISTETEEGEQFLNITEGIGAILRFALE